MIVNAVILIICIILIILEEIAESCLSILIVSGILLCSLAAVITVLDRSTEITAVNKLHIIRAYTDITEDLKLL